jgi:hypothetical protein
MRTYGLLLVGTLTAASSIACEPARAPKSPPTAKELAARRVRIGAERPADCAELRDVTGQFTSESQSGAIEGAKGQLRMRTARGGGNYVQIIMNNVARDIRFNPFVGAYPGDFQAVLTGVAFRCEERKAEAEASVGEGE